jgi:hypothetical protein
MRDKIFQASEGIAVTDSSSLSQASREGSSVHIGWGTTLLIIVLLVSVATVATKVAKKKDDKGGVGDAGGSTK